MNLLCLKDLSYRFGFLLCLLSGQRSFSLDNKSIEDSKVRFTKTEKLIKHTRAGTHQKPLEFLGYPINQKLCIFNHWKVYLDKTKSLRNDERQLLISWVGIKRGTGMAEWRNGTAKRNGGTELLLLSLKHILPLGLFRMYLQKLGHKNLGLKITIYLKTTRIKR